MLTRWDACVQHKSGLLYNVRRQGCLTASDRLRGVFRYIKLTGLQVYLVALAEAGVPHDTLHHLEALAKAKGIRGKEAPHGILQHQAKS